MSAPEPAPALAEPAAAAARVPARVRHRRLRRFLAHRPAVASAIVLLVLAAATIGAPWIEAALGLDANAPSLGEQLLPPGGAHLLGTDELGRDVFLRLLYGGRISLAVGVFAAGIAAVIGTFLGIVAGYYGGRLDTLLMRVTDGVMSLPILPLLIVLAAVDLRKLGLPDWMVSSETASVYRIVLIIAVVGWTTVARLVRGATLSMRTRDFVRAAEALGATGRRIMAVHILPNVAGPVIVATTLSVGGIILSESVLSFLGLGIQAPLPSWGNMLNGAQEMLTNTPLLAIYPGAAIMITVIAFNFLGDGLQDALDPRAGD